MIYSDLTPDDLTPDEFDEMYQENEKFSGRCADFGKLQLYKEIRGDLTAFLQNCDDVLKLTEASPNQYERNAVIYLDVKPISTFDHTELAELVSIMRKADHMIVCGGTGCDCVRFSFGIENVWID